MFLFFFEPIARLGHIAIFSDAFSVCAYAFYQLSRDQKIQVIEKKEEWRKSKFSGVIVNEQGILDKFDSILLETSNERVIDGFTYELTRISNSSNVKVKGGL